MKAIVKLSHIVYVTVEGKNEDSIMEWALQQTPRSAIEACNNARNFQEDYNEEIVKTLGDEAVADVSLNRDGKSLRMCLNELVEVHFNDGTKKRGYLISINDHIYLRNTKDIPINEDEVKDYITIE